MLILISAIFFYCLYAFIIAPTVEYCSYQRWKEYDTWEKVYKIRMIREFYPQLRELCYSDIDKQFGVEQLYDTIGKLYLKNR